MVLGRIALDAGMGAVVAVVRPSVAQGGGRSGLFMAAHRAAMLFCARSGAGGRRNSSPLAVAMVLGRIALDADMVGFTVVLPNVAQCGDGLHPRIFMILAGSMFLALKGAVVLYPAIFHAGGILVADLIFFAEVLAMDDLLQLIIVVGIPQSRVVGHARHRGQLFFGIVFAQILAILFATRTICPMSLLQFDQDMIPDVDAGARDHRIHSVYAAHIAQLDISVFSTVNVDSDFLTGFAPTANGNFISRCRSIYRIDFGVAADVNSGLFYRCS